MPYVAGETLRDRLTRDTHLPIATSSPKTLRGLPAHLPGRVPVERYVLASVLCLFLAF